MISSERAEKIAGIYYDDLYHLCLFRLGKDEDARDVVQNIFLFFQEHCDKLDDLLIKSWLYSVADKKIKEQFRRIAKREKTLVFGLDLDEFEDYSETFMVEPDNLISSEEIEIKKKDIMATLTEKEFRLFEMVYIRHLEYEELAKALGVTVNTARTRVYRLNLKIKERVAYAFMVLLLLLIKT